MNEVVISTGRVNCYGSRVLTSGIDLTQYRKNPILLWMHRRSYEGNAMPIGRIENLRIEGDKLIGTPVFDLEDEFAQKIARKWEQDFIRMASASIEIMETSSAPELLQPGQTRPTVTRSRLEEVSIVDIGGNDDAIRLTKGGAALTLAKGEDCEQLPLLSLTQPDNPNLPQKTNPMNQELLQLLGLQSSATESEAVSALRLLKAQADQASALMLSSITALVDNAIAERRVTADKRDHFIALGKSSGLDMLTSTLALMKPTMKPTNAITPTAEHVTDEQPKAFTKLSEVPADQLRALRNDNPKEYARLYKAEYGLEPQNL